jgi:hypothetical protein
MLISTGGRTVDEVLNACVFGCLRQVFTLEYLPGWIMWHVGLYTMDSIGSLERSAQRGTVVQVALHDFHSRIC